MSLIMKWLRRQNEFFEFLGIKLLDRNGIA